jgi:hypothetical protein
MRCAADWADVPVIHLTDVGDPRLADYRSLTDVELRRRIEPAEGIFIAESAEVITRALAAGMQTRSVLVEDRWLAGMADSLAIVEQQGALAGVGRDRVPEPQGRGRSGLQPGPSVHRGDAAARAPPRLASGAEASLALPQAAATAPP